MKKIILGAVAAGALAIGGTAAAQDLGAVLSNIFGYPSYPTYPTQPAYGPSIPAVVAGTQPYGYGAGSTTIYTDQYGRQYYYDQYGQQVIVSQGQTSQIVGYDSWGRPVYGTTRYNNYALGGTNWDRDGDGIANTRDRWPDDRRYR